jgi:hypothetical protein
VRQLQHLEDELAKKKLRVEQLNLQKAALQQVRTGLLGLRSHIACVYPGH